MQALRLWHGQTGSAPQKTTTPVAFDLPEMKTLNDAVPAMGALVKAVGQGDLTPAEAAELTKMVQAFAKIIETAALFRDIDLLIMPAMNRAAPTLADVARRTPAAVEARLRFTSPGRNDRLVPA